MYITWKNKWKLLIYAFLIYACDYFFKFWKPVDMLAPPAPKYKQSLRYSSKSPGSIVDLFCTITTSQRLCNTESWHCNTLCGQYSPEINNVCISNTSQLVDFKSSCIISFLKKIRNFDLIKKVSDLISRGEKYSTMYLIYFSIILNMNSFFCVDCILESQRRNVLKKNIFLWKFKLSFILYINF